MSQTVVKPPRKAVATPPAGQEAPPASSAGQPQRGVEVVVLRQNFYGETSRRLLPAVLGSLALNLVLAAGTLRNATYVPPNRYVPVRPDGGLLPERPLTEPSVTDADLMNWTSRSISQAYTFSHRTYRESLMKASEAFTDIGWPLFMKAIMVSRNLQASLARKLEVRTEVRAAPVIVDGPSIVGGALTWVFTIPLKMTIEGPKDPPLSEYWNARVTVVRRRATETADGKGLGIHQVIIDPGEPEL